MRKERKKRRGRMKVDRENVKKKRSEEFEIKGGEILR